MNISQHISKLNVQCIIIIIIICYIYLALFWVLKALYIEGGGVSSSTTSVQHPPGWCDGSHIAPEPPPTHTHTHTRYRWRGDWCGVIESISVWGMIRRPWWSEANGQFGQDAGVTPLFFFEGHPGIFNYHRESGPRFNVSSEGQCFFQYSVPVTTLGR